MEAAPRRTLRVGDAMAIVVGIVVGAGIFRTPPLVAATAGSEAATLFAWALDGGNDKLGGTPCGRKS